MAVPTIYAKLLKAQRVAASSGAERLRLFVSGSASLPESVLEQWRDATTHTLLERMGMTETGMLLSNPYAPASARRQGHVGAPLPGVEARIGDDDELQVRSKGFFTRYFDRPEATAAAFTADGWFRTGDQAAVTDDGVWRIAGRNIEIFKIGGEKVSAIDVESVLLTHPGVEEVAVVGMPHPQYEQEITAVVVEKGDGVTLDSVRAFCSSRLAKYKMPRAVHTVAELPRNAMGKLVRPDLVKLVEEMK